jgi:hypothetical protein
MTAQVNIAEAKATLSVAAGSRTRRRRNRLRAGREAPGVDQVFADYNVPVVWLRQD